MAWHGMGRGKTLSCLWEARDLMSGLRKAGVMAPKFMVVCPNSAVPTWKVECNAETPDLNGSMVIYPYSQLHNAMKALKYYDLRMIIFDESHAMKSPETDRIVTVATFLQEVAKINGQFQGGRIILATGTPLPNNAAELYTSWAICGSPNAHEAGARLLDRAKFENWRKTFAHQKDMNWVIGKGKPKGQQRSGHAVKYEGVNNEDKLQKLLTPFVHFRQGGGDLPQAHEIEIDLGLDDDKLLEDADIERPEFYMAAVERLSRAKIPYMINWIKDYVANYPGQQLMVFTMNRAPLDALMEAFPKIARLMVGSGLGSSLRDRAQNLADFQQGKFQIFGLTYACGAESLNCQNAKVSLYHGFPWNDAKRRQAMARTNRSGQQEETLHYFMMSGQNDHKVLCDVKAKGETERRVEDLLIGNNNEKSLDTRKSLLDLYL